jgi:hypothetical protein
METPPPPPPGSKPPERSKPVLSGPITEPMAKSSPAAKPPPPPARPRPPSAPAAAPETPRPVSRPPVSAPVAVAAPAADAGAFGRAKALYAQVFPAGSPRRRYGPAVLVGLVLVLLLLAQCAISATGRKISEASAARTEAKRVQSTGVLVVKSNRPEATVEARRVVAAGQTPEASVQGPQGGTLSYLSPGKYAVTLHAPGWPDAHGEVDVAPGAQAEATVNFQGGSLRLDSLPTGATVKYGNEVLGKTPLVVPLLPPGELALTLEYPAWPALPFKASIALGQESTASVRLPHGKVILDTSPSGATILQGRTTLGHTPLTLEQVPAGVRKYTVQAKGFPTVEVALTVVDGQDTTYTPALGSFFPALDPAALLREVWIPDDRSKITTGFNSTTGIYRPRNDIVKNIQRETLYNHWLHKPYKFAGVVKSYDAASGRVEFAEQKSELARHRLLAQVTPGTKLAAALTKDTTLAVYGTLTAVEEPAWPGRVITLELTDADFLPDEKR